MNRLSANYFLNPYVHTVLKRYNICMDIKIFTIGLPAECVMRSLQAEGIILQLILMDRASTEASGYYKK